MPDTADLASVTARFSAYLHAAGVEIGPDRSTRLATAMVIAPPATTDEMYWMGRVTLTGTPEEIAIYDRVFADIFLGVSDVADSRGDPNQPNLDAIGGGRKQPPASDTAAEHHADGANPSAPRRTGDDSAAEHERELPVGAPAADAEHLRHRDFADCSIDELLRLRALVATMRLDPPMRPSRRRRRHPSGDAIDRRASMRRARRTGGHPAQLVRRRRRARPRRVVLIADVSGSMEAYSRAYLYLLHGAARVFSAETFVFSTRLTRLTRRLATTDPELAMRQAVGDVEDWSGGTRIGEAVGAFNDRWGRRGLARGAIVVIVSDGWEGGDPDRLGVEMARLSRLAHRIVWVNPRAKSERFTPTTAGMAAALPHVDDLASGHDLVAFDDVIDAICRN